MQLFSRTRTANPEHALEAIAFSTEMAQYASQVSGLEVIPWVSVYGRPNGTVSFSARVESRAAMGAAQEKLLADPGYQKRVGEAARLFIGTAEDTLIEFLGFAGSGGNAGKYAYLVSAQCAQGKIAEAMAWGADIMNHVSKLSDLDVAFGRGLYGPWATLGWIMMADTLEQLDAADAAMSGDPTYVESLDVGGDLFVPGAATSWLVRRLS